MTVYIDLYFLLNTMMNTVVLYLSSRLVKEEVTLFRLLSGAVIGGIFSSFALLFTMISILNVILSVIIISVMTIVTYGFKSPRNFLKNSIFTVMISAQISGISELSAYLLGYKGKPDSAFLILCFTFPVIFISGLVYVKYIRKKLDVVSCETVIQLKNGKGTLILNGLYDSGNLLKDPYSGNPVVLVTGRALEKLCGDESLDAQRVLIESEEKYFSSLMIPISGWRGKKDLITGFRPEYVLLKKGGVIKNDIYTKNITVGIVTDITDFSGFDCLLPAEII